MPLKILRFFGWTVLAIALLFVLSMVGGKFWLEHHVLRQEIHLVDGTLRIYGGALKWDLKFHLDSAWYRSPVLQARLGNTEIHAGLPAFAQVRVDTAFVHFSAARDATHPRRNLPDSSFAFPIFKIPVKAALNIRAVQLENDSGILVSVWNIEAHNPDGSQIHLDIGKVTSPFANNLSPSISASMNWSKADSVDLNLNVLREKDQIHLISRLAQKDLWRGRVSLQAQVENSNPYASAFGLKQKNLPFAHDVHLDIHLTRGDSVEGHALLQSQVDGFSSSLPLALSSQKMEVRVDGINHVGQWQIKSQGRSGEVLALNGDVRKLQLAESDSLLPLWQRFTASTRGYAEKFRVRAGRKMLVTGAHVEHADWNGQGLSMRVITEDHSIVQAQAQQVRGNWNGNFSVHVTPSERWVLAFVDTNVSFAALDAAGIVSGKTVTVSLRVQHLSAYGAKLDSLTSQHIYSPHGYELKSAQLYTQEDTWSLFGTVETAKVFPVVNFTLENPRYGGIQFFQVRDSMQVTANHFHAGELPYAGLEKIPVQKPVVDGSFEWNWKRRNGAWNATAMAEFQKQQFVIETQARWNARSLDLENLMLHSRESSIIIRSRLNLNGRQFYELNKLRLPDYKQVSLETPEFDLAWAESIFRPEPFLKSGGMQGNLIYADSGGFQGSLAFTGLAPREEIGDVTLKRLQLDGNGDKLIVLGVTQSESTPLLRDSLRIALTHALEDSQQIHIDAVAADSLHLQIDAVTSRFNGFRGRLQIQGGASLPENSGLLQTLHVDVDFGVPSRNAMTGATLTTRTFEGDYLIPPVTRQHFSLTPTLNHGMLNIPDLILKDQNGLGLQGTMEYGLKNKVLHAQLTGSELAVQWTDNRKVDLKNLRAEVRMDSGGTRVNGGFSQGTVLYVDPPLHAEGDLRDVSFAYALPPASLLRTGNRGVPSLEFSGSLSHSMLRYRLKTLSAITELFQNQHNKKKSGRVHPIQLSVRLHTLGDDNRIDSDILRLTWVGDFNMRGVYPYTLVQGRMNSLKGELGIENEAYQIRQLEVKWLNAPLEEGEAQLDARKNLAAHCDNNSASSAARDSCSVITRLNGPLSQLQFSYDSDCGGAYGAGANVAAILYSMQRGCYDPSFSNGGSSGYGQKGLSLLEPTLNHSISGFVGRHSNSWIAATEITGLGSLAGKNPGTGNDTLTQALSLQVTSKEFLRLRLKIKSGYHTESQDLSSPWENLFAIEWRPPFENYVNDPDWKFRLKDHVTVAASVHTLPVQRTVALEDPVQKAIGINYGYDFWGFWWNKSAKSSPDKNRGNR